MYRLENYHWFGEGKDREIREKVRYLERALKPLSTKKQKEGQRSITWTCLFLPTVYTRFGGSLELKI
nr:hypothetical protein CFP56_56265 [Quercus suber]